MDEHGWSTTTSVVELRLRLYRPAPPAGAVEAYLDALRAMPQPLASRSPAPPHPHEHRGAITTVLAATCVVGALAAAVLIGHRGPALLAAPATADRPATVGAVAGGTATDAPLPAPPLTGVALGDLSGTAPASKRFVANGNRVVASVLCTGSGTIALRLGTEPPVVLTCETGPPALAMIASTERLDGFTITVTPDGPIRWSLAAGALTG